MPNDKNSALLLKLIDSLNPFLSAYAIALGVFVALLKNWICDLLPSVKNWLGKVPDFLPGSLFLVAFNTPGVIRAIKGTERYGTDKISKEVYDFGFTLEKSNLPQSTKYQMWRQFNQAQLNAIIQSAQNKSDPGKKDQDKGKEAIA